jgi:hypothetical protein
LYGNLSTTTATSEINENVESMSRFLTTNRNIELLEPYDAKVSRTVLRGEGSSNAPDLLDLFLDNSDENLRQFERTARNMQSLAQYSRSNQINKEWVRYVAV